MFAYGYVNSLEQDVMSASPAQLVGMLYQGALDAVNAARPHLWAGEIAQRSRQLTRAQMILSELTASLDFARGGDVAKNLGRLYDYMGRRLTEANFQQTEEPLLEVSRLLQNLVEAWEGVAPEAAFTPFASETVPERYGGICEYVG